MAYFSSRMPAVAPKNIGVLAWLYSGMTSEAVSRHFSKPGTSPSGSSAYDEIPKGKVQIYYCV